MSKRNVALVAIIVCVLVFALVFGVIAICIVSSNVEKYGVNKKAYGELKKGILYDVLSKDFIGDGDIFYVFQNVNTEERVSYLVKLDVLNNEGIDSFNRMSVLLPYDRIMWKGDNDYEFADYSSESDEDSGDSWDYETPKPSKEVKNDK